MDEKRTDDRWRRLVNETRRGPLGSINPGPFLSQPKLSARRGFISIGESRGLRRLGVVFWPIFSVGIYWAVWSPELVLFTADLARSGPLADACFVIGMLVFLYAFAALAVIVPALLLLRQRDIRWEMIGRSVTVQWGFLFNPQRLVFDRRELKAVLTTTDRLGDYPYPSGEAALVLEHSSFPGEVFLAHASTAGGLLPLFAALAEFLPSSRDATLVKAALPDGHMLAVSRAARGGGYPRLRFRGPRVAEFSSSFGSYVSMLPVLAFGAGFLWVGTGMAVLAVRLVPKAGLSGESLLYGISAVMCFFQHPFACRWPPSCSARGSSPCFPLRESRSIWIGKNTALDSGRWILRVGGGEFR